MCTIPNLFVESKLYIFFTNIGNTLDFKSSSMLGTNKMDFQRDHLMIFMRTSKKDIAIYLMQPGFQYIFLTSFYDYQDIQNIYEMCLYR